MTTEQSSRQKLPSFLPGVQELTILDGTTELSSDVRLVTSNVLPMQRKAMRGVLTAVGIRVVANKKKFIIEAQVLPAEEFDLSTVPEHVRDEYYELEVRDNRMYIRTASQLGALWGTQTLAAIYRAEKVGSLIPNMMIRDWPATEVRGFFLENRGGVDRMTMPDWAALLDRIAFLKANLVSIGAAGHWSDCACTDCCSRDAETLMVPVEEDVGETALKTERCAMWYAPTTGEWHEDSYCPYLFEDDFFSEVANYLAEKSISLCLTANDLLANTLLVRHNPGIAAVDSEGKALPTGFCLSSAEARSAVETFFGSMIERNLPRGLSHFSLQLGGPVFYEAEGKIASRLCQCPECTAKSESERIRDFVLWLTETIRKRNVETVVIACDACARELNFLDEDFASALETAGLTQHVVLNCINDEEGALSAFKNLQPVIDAGVRAWVTPVASRHCEPFQTASDALADSIELMDTVEGICACTVNDPAWYGLEASLSEQAWKGKQVDFPDIAERWGAARFRDEAEQFTRGLKTMTETFTDYHATTILAHDCCNDRYPLNVLENLLAENSTEAASILENIESAMQDAGSAFEKVCKAEGVFESDLKVARSLAADAMAVEKLAAITALFLQIHEADEAGKLQSAQLGELAERRAGLLEAMEFAEENKPDFASVTLLRKLSIVLKAMDRIVADCTEVIEGKQEGASIRWAGESA